MTQYTWNLEELLSKKKEYKEKANLYEELLDLYSELIENYDYRITPTDPEYENDVLGNIYDSISREKVDLVTNAIEITKDFYVKQENFKYSTLILNDEQLIDRTRALFTKIPNQQFLNKFDYFTNPDNHLLHIKHHKKLSTDYLGITLVDTFKHQSFGLVARHNNLEDIVTLGHEIFHMIVREQEQPFFCTTNKSIYTETEGFFADLLLEHLLELNNYNKQETQNIRKNDLTNSIDSIQTSFIVKNGLASIKQGDIKFNKLKSTLSKYHVSFPVCKKNFLTFLTSTEEDIETDMDYAVSYLTALDLFKQYETDPERALYHLLQIPRLEGTEPKKDLEKINVTFFEDGYKNLENQCKKLLKTRTTSYKK